MIYYGKQSISEADIEAVTQVLRSDFLTQGPEVERFEKKVANYCGANYAVAVTNATAALHIACMAAGLEQGDSLWTSPITFVASANCGRYCGADVNFVDIDQKTYNMSVEQLKKKLEQTDKIPKVVVPVHLAGQSCEMEEIYALGKQYGFTVLEDAAHALGAEYRGKKVGCCEFSDMAVFSFHPVKIITTGEGGMVLTNSKELYEKLLLYRSHCITRDENKMSHTSDGDWYYQQIALGFNYRMTDFQAALGSSQMNKLDEFVERRQYLAERYGNLLQGVPVQCPVCHHLALPSWHLYIVRAKFQEMGITRQELFRRMKQHGIILNLHYIPVHMQPYYEKLGFCKGDFPISEMYYEEAFTLPLYYGLTDDEQEEIVNRLAESLA